MMPVIVALMLVLSFIAGWLIGYDYCKEKWQSKIDLFRNEKIKAENAADLMRKELNRSASRNKTLADFNEETA